MPDHARDAAHDGGAFKPRARHSEMRGSFQKGDDGRSGSENIPLHPGRLTEEQNALGHATPAVGTFRRECVSAALVQADRRVIASRGHSTVAAHHVMQNPWFAWRLTF